MFMDRLRFIDELFDLMMHYGIVTRNPCEKIKLTSTERRLLPPWETEPLEDEEFVALYQAAVWTNNYEIAGVLMASENAGCRPDEIANLQFKHIFLEERCMRYNTSKGNVDAEEFLTDQFYEYLVSLGTDHDPEEGVLPTYYAAGGEQKLSVALVELMEEAGIDRKPFKRELEEGKTDLRHRKRTKYKKRPYSARHTVHGRLSDTFSIEVTSKVLNHRNVRTTMTYAKPQRSTMKAAAKHLSTKVVGSVSLFKEEQAKHAAAEAEKKRQAEEQARQLLEQARQLAAAVAYSDGCRTVIPISVGQHSDFGRTPFRFLSDSVPG
jgi:integrase